MKKEDFAKRLKEKCDLKSIDEALTIVFEYAQVSSEFLSEQGTVTLPFIGSVKTITRKPRKAHVVKTGKKIDVPEKQALKFTAKKSYMEIIFKEK